MELWKESSFSSLSWGTFFPQLQMMDRNSFSVRPASEQRRKTLAMRELPIGRLRFDHNKLYGRATEVELLQKLIRPRDDDTTSNDDRVIDNVENMKDISQYSNGDSHRAAPSSPPDAKANEIVKVAAAKAILFISGLSGVGKTSLANQLRKPVAAAGGIFVQGKYDFQLRSVPYSGIAAAMDQLCHQLHSQMDRDVQKVNLLREELGEAVIATVASLVPQLRHVLQSASHNEEKVHVNADGYNDKKESSDLPPCSHENVYGETSDSRDLQNKFRYAMVRFLSAVASWGPLVLCLDDLQWADAESLEFLEHLMCDLDTTSNERIYQFVLVGCYRSNQVDEAHLLSHCIRNLRSIQGDDIKLTEIAISPLEVSAVNEMISELVDKEVDKTNKLAEIVYRKTMGNPFFVIEFLKSLQEAELLLYNLGIMEWMWSEEDIENHTSATKNVVDLMRTRILELPPELSEMLPLAACLGSAFPEPIITLAFRKFTESRSSRSADQPGSNVICAEDWLKLCVEEGILVRQAGNRYRWVHDKVQELALSLVDTSKQNELKFFLGDMLLSNLEPQEKAENVYLLVNLLNECPNIGRVRVSKRVGIAQLCLEAAKASVVSASFGQASVYIKNGIAWLPEHHWRDQYELSLSLYSIGADVEYVNGNVERQEFYFNAVVTQKHAPITDKLPCYLAMIDSMNNRNLIEEAIALNESVLAELGCSFPKHGRLLHKIYGIIQVKAALKKYTPCMIARLPRMDGAEKNAVISLSDKLVNSTYFTDSDLLPLVVFRSFQWSLKYGISLYTPPAFAILGLVFCGELGDIQVASALADHAVSLAERWKLDGVMSRTLMIAHGIILSSTKPLHLTRLPLLRSYQIGMSTGDVQSAFYSIMAYMRTCYFTGKNLEALEEDYRIYTDQMDKYKQEQAHFSSILYFQLIMNLRGKSDHTYKLSGSAFDEDRQQGIAEYLRFNLLQMQILASYMFIEDQKGAVLSLEIEKSPRLYKETSMGFLQLRVNRAVVCYGATRKTGKRRYMKVADKSHALVKRWIQQGNPNLAHLEKLISAERAAMKRNAITAAALFEEGAFRAARLGLIHDQALINERHGDFLAEIGNFTDAEYQYERAYKLYQEWGATAKVDIVRRKVEGICQSDQSSGLSPA